MSIRPFDPWTVKEDDVAGTGNQHRWAGRSALALAIVIASIAALVVQAAPRVVAQEQNAAFDTRVRFLHADTDEGELEIALNVDGVLDEFEYGSLSDWIGVDPGAVRLTITEDRAGINYAIFDTVYPFAAGNDYLVTITDALVLTTAVDRSPVPDDAARLQVVHASVDLPAVNVIATGSDTTLASQLAYAQNSEYVEVPAGSFDIGVRAAETGETAFTQAGVPLTAGMVYSLVVIGSPGDDDHELMIVPVDDETLDRAGMPES